ncbi:hypothetical protein F652_198 [Enterobacteriaceae bacterium bta3-1]|nr:hypothetical protein F652_198 [Enterobacteriaceae bacterium bta3-1]
MNNEYKNSIVRNFLVRMNSKLVLAQDRLRQLAVQFIHAWREI